MNPQAKIAFDAWFCQVLSNGKTLKSQLSPSQAVVAKGAWADAWDAANDRAQRQAVQQEPTEEMIRAGCLSQQATPEYDNYEDWRNSHSGGIVERIRGFVRKDYLAMIAAAPPPAQVPLTEARLKEIAVQDEFLLYCDEEDFIEIARAIEQAHGIR